MLQVESWIATPSISTRSAVWLQAGPLDPIELPRVLVDVLQEFDGRPIDETLSEIEETTGLQIEQPLVRRLLDFRVLLAE